VKTTYTEATGTLDEMRTFPPAKYPGFDRGGILFRGDMVQATFEGRKTQTRRIPNHRSKYWSVCDTLWVKETFCKVSEGDIVYRADGIEEVRADHGDGWKRLIWTPSLFMPKIYSRITIHILEVRYYHLQRITPEQAIAEGINPNCGDPVKEFSILWDSINAKRDPSYAWVCNPLVLAVMFVPEFKKVQRSYNMNLFRKEGQNEMS